MGKAKRKKASTVLPQIVICGQVYDVVHRSENEKIDLVEMIVRPAVDGLNNNGHHGGDEREGC